MGAEDMARATSIALPGSNEGQIRMKKTLREMFTPVSLGALTTLIGVAPIAAAQFPYFRQYYFKLYVMIVLFGWLNGVVFQVTILSLLAPLTPSSSRHSTSSVGQQQDAEPTKVEAEMKLQVEMAEKDKQEEQQREKEETQAQGDAETATAGGDTAPDEAQIEEKHTRDDKDAP